MFPRDGAFPPRFLYTISTMSPFDTYETEHAPRYAGLRLSADEYLALDNDGFRYEVVNGIAVLSPNPSLRHQLLLAKLLTEIDLFLQCSCAGKVVLSVDVRFAADLVYRPDICFYRAGRLDPSPNRLDIPPDFIIQVVSPGSRAIDTRTKRDDYERFGVSEYWTIDAQTLQVQQYVLRDNKYTAATPSGDTVNCQTIAGFALDLQAIREAL